MIKNMMHILSIALIYCGTVFGAGFASGQEIVSFFSSHFLWGIFTSVFVGFLFSFFGYIICAKAKQLSFNSAKEYFDFLFPKVISEILHFICMSFLVVSFCIMIAGCGTLFQEQFTIKPVIGSLFSLVICYKIIKNKVGGLARFNAVITPFMFLGVVVLCCIVLCRTDASNQALEHTGSFKGASFSGMLYLSYNLVSAAAVLVPCSAIAKSKRHAGFGGLFGGILVAVPLVLLTVILTLYPDFQNDQLPFFALICALHPKLKLLCGLLLYCAMLTTAASSGVSVIARVRPKYSGKFAAVLCAAAFAASFIPFDILVKTMYSIFGVCGLLLIFGILKSILSKH